MNDDHKGEVRKSTRITRFFVLYHVSTRPSSASMKPLADYETTADDEMRIDVSASKLQRMVFVFVNERINYVTNIVAFKGCLFMRLAL